MKKTRVELLPQSGHEESSIVGLVQAELSYKAQPLSVEADTDGSSQRRTNFEVFKRRFRIRIIENDVE